MDKPVEIYFHNMDHNESVKAEIGEKCQELQRLYDHIHGINVKLDRPNRHHQHGNQYHITIEVIVPGQRLVASHASDHDARHETPIPTINAGFHVIKAQLEKYTRKQHDDIKHHGRPLQGRVDRIFHDHGFIELPDGNEIYLHKNSVLHPGFEQLEGGTPVRVVINEGETSVGMQATSVQPIDSINDADEDGASYKSVA